MDRISELPDSLITEILSLLPMSDVVRTTILSKRWENVWNTVPSLIFYGGAGIDSVCPPHEFGKFVIMAIKSWRGSKIQKLEINFDYEDKDWVPSSSDLNSWMHFVMENKVEELHLGVGCYGGAFLSCLHSCSWLKVLSLRNLRLNLEMDVQWNQLKSLMIERHTVREREIEQVLRGSPQLEVLILSLWYIAENLSIRSNSLKKLSLRNNCMDKEQMIRVWVVGGRDVRICTPNLHTLEISELSFGKRLRMDAPSLTRATIDFSDPTLSFIHNILPIIQHVERLTLSGSCIKALASIEKRCVMMKNVKCLELIPCDFKEYKHIMHTFEFFPQLHKLVLQPLDLNDTKASCPMSQRDLPSSFLRELSQKDLPSSFLRELSQRDLPSSFLLELRTVEVTWTNGVNKSIFPILKMLLKYASKLEKMVFRDTSLTARKQNRTWIIFVRYHNNC